MAHSAISAFVVLFAFCALPFAFGNKLEPMVLVGCGFISSFIVFAISAFFARKNAKKSEALIADFRSDNGKMKRDLVKLRQTIDEQQQRICRVSSLKTSLASIAQETMKSLEIGKVLEYVMDTLVRNASAKRASLWLVDPVTGKIVLQACRGWTKDQKENVVVKKGRGIVGHVAATGQILDSASMQRDPKLASIKKSGLPSVICAPLVIKREVLGVFNIETADPKRRSSLHEDLQTMTFLGSLAAMAIKNARMFGQTKELADKDGLTKLFTHRYFQDTMDREIKRADRYGDQVSLVITDIDHFKKFNDTYGHQIGDLVLAETAAVIQNTAREMDTVARYGGEEFALVLPNTEKDGAFQLAERIRSNVEKHAYQTDQGVLSVTISLGVSTFPGDSKLKTVLIQQADKALYCAKEDGRNKVCLAEPSPETRPPDEAPV